MYGRISVIKKINLVLICNEVCTVETQSNHGSRLDAESQKS